MTASSEPFLPRAVAILGAENVEIGFGTSLFQFFLFDQAAELADFLGDAADALGDGFKFESELAALSAEGFDLNASVGDFGFEAAGFAVGASETLFGLRELIAQTGGRRNGVENRDARFFLLALDFGETGGGGSGFLLADASSLCAAARSAAADSRIWRFDSRSASSAVRR